MSESVASPTRAESNDAVGAVILAGGQARRMGGTDKALVELAGRSMCQWVISAVQPQVAQLVINANRNADAYARFEVPVIADLHGGHLGPLAGLHAALAALETLYVFMCPCDSPFIPGELVRRLADAARQPGVNVAVAHDGKREQPVFCVVHRRVADSLAAFLDAGERKIDRWYAGEATQVVNCSDLADAFLNINTYEELAAAEQRLVGARVEQQPSCLDPAEPALLPVEVARERLAAAVTPVDEHEQIGLRESLGRVLAMSVLSPISVPAADNSAMDGYAISSASIPATGDAWLKMIGTAWAGSPFSGLVAAGEAVRIFTGGIMPAGADTVVIQEHVEAAGEQVRIDSRVEPRRNVRAAGEDVQQGSRVFDAGQRLGAAHMGVLASLGIARVSVVRRVRVAFFSTGSELRSLDEHAGQALADGALFDSNRHALAGLLQSAGVEAIDLGLVADDAAATRSALSEAARHADLIISSGGVSAGDADHVSRVFHELGQVAFWKIAIRPGRPLVFGQLGEAVFFGLPGNPVAVMVTFLKFVRPAIQRLMGMPVSEPPLVPARCLSALRKSAGREEYQRGVLTMDESGELVVSSTGMQGAGRLTSMSSANCLIVLPTARSSVSPGEQVHVQPFHGLLDA